MTYKEMLTKQLNDRRDHTYKCKCTHSMLINNVDHVVCDHCGEMVFTSDKARFDYRMKEAICKQKKSSKTILEDNEEER